MNKSLSRKKNIFYNIGGLLLFISTGISIYRVLGGEGYGLLGVICGLISIPLLLIPFFNK